MKTSPYQHLSCLGASTIMSFVIHTLIIHAGSIPKRMTYEDQQSTSFFHQSTGRAPVVSNVLDAIVNTRDVWPYARDLAQASIDVIRIGNLQLLPYLVTPGDSGEVARVIHACADGTSNPELLRVCGRMLIETAFDVTGGAAILQRVVHDVAVPLEERVRAATTLVGHGVPAGYDLMREAFDSTNQLAQYAAEDLLLMYCRHIHRVQAHPDTTGLVRRLCTSTGAPLNLPEVVTHIKHKMALPFITNDIPVLNHVPQE